MELEDLIEKALWFSCSCGRVFYGDYCPPCIAKHVAAAVKEAGCIPPEEYKKMLDDWTEAVQENENYALHYVQLAPDQAPPENPYPEDIFPDGAGKQRREGYELAKEDMLKIQPDGTAFRRVIVLKEEVKP
ncbi:MAG: hypothetical protein PHN44_01245 [Candidatus Marinimicrobia bacterium]|nr:hypothetical protein [Candidatus Neomarinimicrobiota bacterium]MDD5539080.1 hypothetical protein [Candidatus Neomarinimicrobiota bacterium]